MNRVSNQHECLVLSVVLIRYNLATVKRLIFAIVCSPDVSSVKPLLHWEIFLATCLAISLSRCDTSFTDRCAV